MIFGLFIVQKFLSKLPYPHHLTTFLTRSAGVPTRSEANAKYEAECESRFAASGAAVGGDTRSYRSFFGNSGSTSPMLCPGFIPPQAAADSRSGTSPKPSCV